MPWSETSPMKERLRFIDDLESCLYTMTELCELYGISRKTGYKWAQRYAEGGVEALGDQPRAPKSCPHRTEERVVEALVVARRQHPRWGPRKLLAYLQRREPDWAWPAVSTAGDILRREGLVTPRRRRRKHVHPGRPTLDAASPNDLWSIDFKGQFRTKDHVYCYPLTIADRCSRYVLECRGLRSTATAGVRPAMERVFREHGLPLAMVSDNGTPFSNSRALKGLSKLSVWWIRLGIEPVRIEPSHPEQNGGHERMHRTLKEETARPPAGSMSAQQRRFNTFRREFNEERPHEALDQRPPAELYQTSPRPYPDRLPEMCYPGHWEIRRVRPDGGIKWRGESLFLSESLGGELVGLEEIDDGIWSLTFGPMHLGRIDDRDRELKL